MAKKNRKIIQDNIHVKLGGMGLYSNTSDKEIAGYQTSGDIENAGNLKGFKRPEDEGAKASFKSEKD